MKISKRPNGSFLMKVETVEATIKGDLTIKESYAMYERLLAAIHEDAAAEAAAAAEVDADPTEPSNETPPKKPRNLKERTAVILSVLKEVPEASEEAIRLSCGATEDKGKVWEIALKSLLKRKKIAAKSIGNGPAFYSLVAPRKKG